MGITKRAVIDNVAFDIEGRGSLEVRVEKLTFLDGVLVQRDHHRIGGLEADANLDAVLAENSDHLEAMGFGRIEQEGIDLLKGVAAMVRTAPRIEAAQGRRIAAQAETEAAAKAEEARHAEAKEEAAKQQAAADEAEKVRMNRLFTEFMASRGQ